MMTFNDIIQGLSGEVIQCIEGNRPVQYLLTDSRKGIFHASSIFFAIKGVRHDGHHFLKQVYAKGVRNLVISSEASLEDLNLKEANILKVGDALAALQMVSRLHRKQFDYPVIGITGSNGKTIVKEWLAQMLSGTQQVIKNPKSYNSQIGVPLAIWNMRPTDTLGVFEAGISLPDEMEKLAAIIQPTIGIITNLGPAHDEGFQDRKQKAEEKLNLFTHCEQILYSRDYPVVEEVMQTRYHDRIQRTWSTQPHQPADLQLQRKEIQDQRSLLHLIYHPRYQHFTLEVPFTDEASIENIMCCVLSMLVLEYHFKDIQRAVSGLRKVNMRLEWKQGVNQCYLLDDSYSNDLLSLQMALEFLQHQSQNQKQTVILSDILQAEADEEKLYHEVLQLLRNNKVDRLILIGSRINQYKSLFGSWFDCSGFPSTQNFLEHIRQNDFHQENILIKGARTFQFEKIASFLQQKIHSTTLEINLDALTHNLNFYKGRLKSGIRLMAMVKAFSYGGGAFEIASLLQFHQVDYLAVAYVDEGITLRENGIHLPILVLNPSEGSFEKMMQYRLEPEVYSLRMLKMYLKAIRGKTNVSPIHLKLDTGMHRLGFDENQIPTLIEELRKFPELKVASIFSHLAVSEDPDEVNFTNIQFSQFIRGADRISQALSYKPLRHILNSAGIICYPDFQLDMVRLGIGLYGIEPAGKYPDALENISTLKTVISQIKDIAKGETVGYGRVGKILEKTKIATIAIGYADGFDRKFGNGRLGVLVSGQTAPTIGNVCMDMTMIDVTGIEVEEGDEVIVFGEKQSVEILATIKGTIPYEILTSISDRVKRVYITNNT